MHRTLCRGPLRTAVRRAAPAARRLCRDARGAVLIEAAITLPILLMLVLGIVNYGLLLMAAHAVQQAANEGARASLAGIDAGERQTLARDAAQKSVGAAGIFNATLVTTSVATSGDFYTVTVSYDVSRARLFGAALLPMPKGPIQRASVVKMAAP